MKQDKKNIPALYRQKFILALLKAFGGSLKKSDFQRYLFLYNNEMSHNPLYYFIPYEYGPFSYQVYADLNNLERINIITNENIIILKNDYNYFDSLKPDDRHNLIKLYNKYKKIKGEDLLSYIYNTFPYYAIKNKIKNNVTIDSNVLKDEQNMTRSLFTLGYEGLTIDQYINKLIRNAINIVIDVRKNPISMKYGFSKKIFGSTIKNSNIEYIHLPELGIESQKRKNLATAEDYYNLFKEYELDIIKNHNSIIKDIQGIYFQKNRLVLTCFENEKSYCHRSVIASILEKKLGIEAIHL